MITINRPATAGEKPTGTNECGQIWQIIDKDDLPDDDPRALAADHVRDTERDDEYTGDRP